MAFPLMFYALIFIDGNISMRMNLEDLLKEYGANNRQIFEVVSGNTAEELMTKVNNAMKRLR